jgi:hypothetical protein
MGMALDGTSVLPLLSCTRSIRDVRNPLIGHTPACIGVRWICHFYLLAGRADISWLEFTEMIRKDLTKRTAGS